MVLSLPSGGGGGGGSPLVWPSMDRPQLFKVPWSAPALSATLSVQVPLVGSPLKASDRSKVPLMLSADPPSRLEKVKLLPDGLVRVATRSPRQVWSMSTFSLRLSTVASSPSWICDVVVWKSWMGALGASDFSMWTGSLAAPCFGAWVGAAPPAAFIRSMSFLSKKDDIWFHWSNTLPVCASTRKFWRSGTMPWKFWVA